MRIEAYLFVPYRGQYRFAFNAEKRHDKIVIEESKKPYDINWDIAMRRRPTLHELTADEGAHASAIRVEYTEPIGAAFRELFDRLIASPNKRHQKMLEQGYVEFVHIKN